jgi:arsenical pump membrane protein
VQQLMPFFGPGLTIALVLTRPRWRRFQVTPAIAAAAGVVVMLCLHVVEEEEIWKSIGVLWRPFVGVGSIMVTAAIAEKVGLLERAAAVVELSTRGPVWVAFTVVFLVAAAVATLFNNDAAILVLTPMIVRLVRRRYPQRHGHLTTPFAFAVFGAAGVAPLVISNPINLVVSSHAGIGFNAYAKVMIPVALAGLAVAFAGLCFCFRKEIGDNTAASGPTGSPLAKMSRPELYALLVIVGGLGSYPLMSYFDGPVWLVAFLGAFAGVQVCRRHKVAEPPELLRAVAWDVLIFLLGVFVMAQGLRISGVVSTLTSLYSAPASPGGQVFLIGTVSAVGSALLNNHPMAILNALAVADVPGVDHRQVLAALIGGDLGPRLLPIGSLAGLLWLRALSKDGVEIPLKQFVRIGATLTLPALLVSLAVLLRVA